MSIKVDDFKCKQGVNNLAYFKLLQDNLKSQETIIQKVIAKFMNTDSTKELWIEHESDDGSWLECPVCHKKWEQLCVSNGIFDESEIEDV